MSGLAVVVSVLLAGCVVVGAVLIVIDVREHRLPNALVLPLYPMGLAVGILRSLASASPAPVVSALASALVLFTAYLALHRFGGGMGGGDVKLAGAIGLVTGSFGWPVAVAATAFAFVLGGVAAFVLVALRRAHRRTRIAFGPFMVVGAAVPFVAPVAPVAPL